MLTVNESSTIHYRILANTRRHCPAGRQAHGKRIAFTDRDAMMRKLLDDCPLIGGCTCTVLSEDSWERWGKQQTL